MATNDFQVFAGGSGANVMSQAAYLNLQARSTGFQTGIAPPPQVNKVWRQGSIMASMIGQFITDGTGQNSVDDGTTAVLETNFANAIRNTGAFTFDASNPPATDYFLPVGGKVIETFNNVTAVPLHIRTSSPALGTYIVTFIISSVNVFLKGISFRPNNTLAVPPAGFSTYWFEPGGLYIAGLGTSTSPASYGFLNPPGIGLWPWSGLGSGELSWGAANEVILGLFFGPAPNDTVNARSPLIMEMMVTTHQNGKMVLAQAGCTGGPSLNFSRWEDTTTQWTSLGTLSVYPNFASAITGTVIIERII